MFRGLFGWGSSSASPQDSASKKQKEVHQVNDFLYELYKPEGAPTMQVLFFHGLRSGDLPRAHLSTWRTEDDSCVWPQEWLPEIFPGAHIFSVNYSACIQNFDMYQMGESLISDLMEDDIKIGQRTSCPVILVGHCVGGLVIKEICCQAHDQLHLNKALPIYKEKLQKFLENIRGIFYYSTPHHGSSVIAKATDGPLFQFFRILNENAERLNFKFEGVQSNYKWRNFGLGECLPTTSSLQNSSNVVVVPEASSRQGDHFHMVPADHNSICQPRSQIDTRFSHLKNLIDTIGIDLEEESKAPEASNVKAAHRPNLEQEPLVILATPTTVLQNESIYVPVKSSHNQLIAEIEKPTGFHVILLYGGVGKGKSTLARYMYECYGKDGHNGNLFEHVIWLSCANCLIHDARTKQFEVLQDHASSSFGDTLPREKSLVNNRIAKAFHHFLGDKKILIILDDVSDPRFLNEMWKAVMGAKNVKYLVTSQKRNICSSLEKDSVCISMQDPTQEEALSILASHVGLRDKNIPNHLQDISKKMVEITEGNLLALACLASHFAYSQDNQDKQLNIRAWQAAYRDLQKLLDSPEDKIVLGNTESAPRSLWAAMKICIGSLDSTDARKLLSFMYACGEEAVPETVLTVWHARMHTSRAPFMKSMEELLMRELVKKNFDGTMEPLKENLHDKGQNDEIQESTTLWSLRSLVKLYMQQDTVTEGGIRSLIDEMIGNEESLSDSMMGCKGSCETQEVKGEKRRVAIVLCALYFDRQHIERSHAITRAGIASNTTDFYDNLHDLRRKAMEHIIWMLDKPVEEGKWTQSDVQCVRKVLLTYICESRLHEESISHLLKLDACTPAQLGTLKVITDICFIEEKPLFVENNFDFLQEILHLIHCPKESSPAQVQEEASQTLSAMCWKALEDKYALRIANTPGVCHALLSSLTSSQPSHIIRQNALNALANLAATDPIRSTIVNREGALNGLVKLLLAADNLEVQKEAARAIANLSSTPDTTLELRIAQEEGALEGLMQCMIGNHDSELEESATWALANLATTDPIRSTIVNREGALNGLVKLLLAADNLEVQKQAARAMANLSSTLDTTLELRIAQEEGALEGLMQCIIGNHDSELEEYATQALANLARTDPIRSTIVNREGALNGLVKLLLAADNLEVQKQAARAMANLSSTPDTTLNLCIAEEEGAVEGLMQSIIGNHDSELQKYGTRALANLATTDPIRSTIVNREGALNGLVKLLLAADNLEVQKEAARAMVDLSNTLDTTLKLRIAQEEGALEGLMQCIIGNHDSKLLEYATWALANLATTDPIRSTIVNREGALNGLVKLLLAADNLEVQKEAGRAMVDLSNTLDTTLKLRIAQEEGALEGLMQCIIGNHDSKLQEYATRALANLATTDPIRSTIVNREGALNGLVKLLLAADNLQVQKEAARAMVDLSNTLDTTLKLRIAQEEGAVEGLMQCIIGNHDSELEEYATQALANLARTDPIRSTIVNREGALNGLVKLLLAADNLEVQKQAARAMANLSSTPDTTLNLCIAEEEGAVEGLMQSIIGNHDSELKKYGTRALANLATTDPIRSTIVNREGALNGLVKLLLAAENLEVQKEAAWAMVNLSNTLDTTLELRIAQEEGALEGLMQCIIGNHDSELEEYATQALANLARTDPIRSTIVNREGALNGLVKLLLAADNLEVQKQAARAMANLSSTPDTTLNLCIAEEEGAVEGLMQSIIGNHDSELQKYGTRALANLATTDPIRSTIVNREGALNGLVKLLLAADNLQVQKEAARAMVDLSNTLDTTLKLRIAQEEGALEGLMQCIIGNHDSELEEYATQALANLAWTDPIRSTIVNREGALNGLVKLLLAADNLEVQKQAARAMAKIYLAHQTLL